MKKCPMCGELNTEEAERCSNCKSLLSPSKKPAVKTYKSYCIHCGKKLEKIYPGNLCHSCHLKKSWLLALFVFLSMLVSFLIIFAINLILGFMLEINLGYLFCFLIVGGSILYANKLANKIFSKQKTSNKRKTNKYSQYNKIDIKIPITKKIEKTSENRYCKICGGLIDYDNQKCTNCGRRYYNLILIKNFFAKKKRRYCKLCGGSIDSNNKKCVNCGKQYFNLNFMKKKLFIILSASLVIVCTFIFCFINFSNKNLSDDIEITNQSTVVYAGASAHLYIQAKPKTEYTINVLFNDKKIAVKELLPQNTDDLGKAFWQWKVDSKTEPGIYTIRIESCNEFITTTLKII